MRGPRGEKPVRPGDKGTPPYPPIPPPRGGCGFQTERDLLQRLPRLLVMEAEMNRRPH